MTLIFDGPVMRDSTYIWLTAWPWIRHFSKGEVVDASVYKDGSAEANQLQSLLSRGLCRVLDESRPRKPAA